MNVSVMLNSAAQVERDWRFAELIARAWVEEGLAIRYDKDPCAVLAEFGIGLANPHEAPALPADPGDDLMIGDLDRAADVAPFSICSAGTSASVVTSRLDA